MLLVLLLELAQARYRLLLALNVLPLRFFAVVLFERAVMIRVVYAIDQFVVVSMVASILHPHACFRTASLPFRAQSLY